MKSNIKMCVDMRLPAWMRKEARQRAVEENAGNAGRGAIPTQVLWAPGRVLRCRFLDGHPTIQNRVQQMAIEWSEYANISFVFGSDPDAEIRISFKQDGSWSFLGTDCLTIPKNMPTMNYGWLTLTTSDTEYSRVVKHEFGHALGLIHEHQHPKVSIPWDKAAAYREYASSQGWTKAEVDTNLFQQYDTGSTQFSEYDKESIMHYAIDNKLTVGDFSIGWNTKLSDTDKSFIARVYPGAIEAKDLKVGAAAASASIGKHGEQDAYRFAVEKKGAYVVETQGSTDVIVSLFNSAGQLLAEDDDGGEGTNARLVATLPAGTYVARVRHYRPTGKGSYQISVKTL